MTNLALFAQSTPAETKDPVQLSSVFESLVSGGPVMIPLGLCSVIAVTWILERSLRMRAPTLGSRALAEQLLTTARERGPASALELTRANGTVLAKSLQPMFERWDESRANLEKAVEDSSSREVRALVSSLRPLTVISVCAPLLGLLGTVMGIIIAFRDIALSDAIGKPEALSAGIAQALVTTAAGLAIAIPTQVAFYWFRAKIDRFWRLVEETGEQLFLVHAGRPARLLPAAPSAALPSDANRNQPQVAAQAAP
jgi:biopolymer transport protein ExbB